MTYSVQARISFLLLGALLLPVRAASSAQSLGEIARQYRKELQAREKKGEVPVKVYTNDDIARMPPLAILESSRQAPPSAKSKQGATSQAPATAGATTSAVPPGEHPGKAETSAKPKQYWQTKFKAARAALAQAKEEQTLVEDELRLLQIQQARELNPDRSKKLNSRIDASTVELESKRVATQKAQAALDEIEKEFKKSGAPQDWIQDDGKPN